MWFNPKTPVSSEVTEGVDGNGRSCYDDAPQEKSEKNGGDTVEEKKSVEQATMELMAARPDLTAAEIAELLPVLAGQALEIF